MQFFPRLCRFYICTNLISAYNSNILPLAANLLIDNVKGSADILRSNALWYLLNFVGVGGIQTKPPAPELRDARVVRQWQVFLPRACPCYEVHGNLPPGFERKWEERDSLPPSLESQLLRKATLPSELAKRARYGYWQPRWERRDYCRDDDEIVSPIA